MTVRPYEESDFDQIKQWGLMWGAKYDDEQLPATGFIIDGVAAYFLYSTDSSVCWLENMITKRGVAPSVRDKAVQLLIDAGLRKAKELGFSVAYAATNIVSAAKRARDNGAHITPNYFLITKDLTQPDHLM